MDPAVAQAIILLSSAVSMAITAVVAYYFPRGSDRFHRNDPYHEYRRGERDRRREHTDIDKYDTEDDYWE
ncbi:MAG TPA: hypothetical protein PLQ14_07365 [Actinomycetota bacterium]|nr:hypothetical protein [Actinomycetota bacterium]